MPATTPRGFATSPTPTSYDPIGTVRRVYEHFGDELEADAEQAMTRCLAGNRQGVHGTHTYRLRDLGLDRAELGSRFGSYGQRHNIPLEPIE